MATDIDRRVVQMEFDNKDFEKNCKQSLSTLEKLKMALNFDGAKGLKDVGEAAKKVDLSQISKSAEKVQVSFSAMQIAGMTAISELTKSFMNFGKNIWDKTFGQIKKGGMARTLKIDQANFQMKALAKNFDEIKDDAGKLAAFMSDMENAISEAVNNTAYGYDAAAAVASQLMASGLKNADQMQTDLRAIAGAAAMTGRSYEDIGNIFTTVASNGRLMTMQLRQFSASGLNMSATLAKHFKTTEATINDMVTKGKISYREFADAVNDAFGESAGKADETWSGVTSNVKAQLSRIGQNFSDPFVKYMIPTLAKLKQLIKDVNVNAIKPLKTTWEMVVSKWTTRLGDWIKSIDTKRLRAISEAIENIFVGVIGIAESIRSAFREVFPKKTSEELFESAKAFRDLTKQLLPTKETLAGLKTIFVALLTPVRLVYNIFKALSGSVMKPLGVAVIKLLGAILRLINAFQPIVNTLTSIISESQLFDNVLGFLANTIIFLIDTVTAFVDAFGQVFSEVFQGEAMKTVLASLKSIADVIQTAIAGALLLVLQLLSMIFSVISVDNILYVLNGIGNILSYIIGLIATGIDTIFGVFKAISESGGILGSIFSIFKSIGEFIAAIFNGEDLAPKIQAIKDSVAQLGDALKDLWDKIKNALGEINVGKLMLIAFGIAIIFLIVSVTRLVNTSEELVRSVGGMVGVLNKIKNAFLGIGRISPIAQMLFAITLAVGVLAAALISLTKVEPEKLKVAAACLGALVGSLLGFSIAMTIVTNKFGGSLALGLKQFVALMVAVAGSIWMLSNALKTLTQVTFNWSQFWEPLLAVIALIGALSLAIIAMNQLSNGKGFNTGALTILAFALSIKIFAGVLQAIAEIDIENKVINVLLGLGTVIGLLYGVAKAMSSFGSFSKVTEKKGKITTITQTGGGAAGSVIGAALSLLLLVTVLKKLADQPVDQILHGLARLALIFVPIMLVVKYLGKISSGTEGGIFKGAFGMLMGLNLLVVSLSITAVLLGGMDVGQLIIGIVAINFILKAISNVLNGAIETLIKNKGSHKNLEIGLKNINKFLIGLGVTMLLLSLSAKIMSTVDLLTLGAMAGILALLGQVCSWMMVASEKTKGVKVGPILAMVAAISAIMAGLAILSFQDPLNMLAAGAALGGCMVALGWMVKLMSSKEMKSLTKSKETQKETKKSALMVFGIAALIAGIAAAMSLILSSLGQANVDFSNRDIQINLIALATSTAIVIGLAFTIYKLIGKMFELTEDEKKVNERLMMLLGLVGVVTILAGVITAMAVAASTISSPASMVAAGAALALAVAAVALVALALGEMPVDKAKHIQNMSKFFVEIAGSLLIIAAAIIPLAAIMTYTDITFGSLMGSVLALVSVLAAITTAFIFISKFSNKLNPDQMKSIGISMVIASASLAIIAVAIAGLAALMSVTPVTFGSIMGSVLALTIIAGVVFGSMALILAASGKNKKNDVSKIKSVGIAMVLAAASLAIIAASIAGLAVLMKGVEDPEGLAGILGVFSVIVLAMMVILAIISLNSKKIDAGKIILVAASFAIFAGAIGVIALAIGALMNLASGADLKKLNKVIEIFTLMVVIVTVMTALSALLSMFGAGGAMAVGIMLGIAGAFAIFAGAVFILAGAAKMLVDAVDTITNMFIKLSVIKLDFGTLKQNLRDFKKLIPLMVDIFRELMAGVGDAIGALIFSFADYGMQAIVELCKGLEKSFPDLLKTLTKILQDVADWLMSDETSAMFVDLFKSIAKLLYDVIKGVLGDLFDWIWEQISDLEGKEKTNKGKEQEKLTADLSGNFRQYYGGYDWKNIRKDYLEARSEVWDFGGESDPSAWFKEEVHYLDWYNDEVKKSVALAIEYRKKQKIGDDEVFAALLENMKQVADANNVAYNSDEIYEYGRKMASLVGILDYYDMKQNYTNKILGEAEASISRVTDTIDGSADAVKEDFDAMNESIDGMAESAKNAEEEVKKTDIFGSILEKGSELFGGTDGLWNKIKKGAETGAGGLKAVFGEIGSKMGDKFGDGFSIGSLNIDFNKFANLIKDGGINVGTIAGLLSGKAQAEAHQLSLEYWQKKAKAKVSSMGAPSAVVEANKSAFANVGEEQWKTWRDEEGKAFANEDAAAKGMLEQAKKMSEEYSDAANILHDIFGYDFPDVTNALGDYTFGLEGATDATDKAKSKFKEFSDTLRDQVKDAMKNIFDDPGEEDFIDTDEMLYRMEENIRRVGKWARQLSELAAKGISEGLLNELREMGPAGAVKVDAFARMTADQLQEANRLYLDSTAMPDEAVNKIVKSYRDAGFNASLGFANGIDQNAADDAMVNLATNGLDALTSPDGLDEKSPSKKTYAIGEYATAGLANGLVDNAQLRNVRNKSEVVCRRIINAFESSLKESKAIELAKNFCNGLILGLQSEGQRIVTYATVLASAIKRAFEIKLRISSPSKEMAEIGKYIMMGVGVGMEDGSTFVERQTNQSAEDIINSMKENFANSLEGIGEDGVYSPVIRPIFDMSLAGQGWNDITSWFNSGQTVDLNSNISRLTPTTDDTSNNTDIINAIKGIDVNGVKNEIQAIRSDISTLQSAMSNMQVVMNTGALVGQLLNPMDAAMGQKAMLNSRGRY